MSSSKPDEIEIDRVQANPRVVAGAVVQTIPKKWTQRKDVKPILDSPKLIFRLVWRDGEMILEMKIDRDINGGKPVVST